MRGKLTALIGAIALIALSIVALGSTPAHSQMSTEVRGVDVLAQRGFGDSRNSYSWSMAWFKGKLYVGTGRQVACVEAETRAFYLPNLHPYNTNPALNTKCPANPYDMALRAEIWQYTPRKDTWRRVYRSPVIPNPRAPGKTIARDIAYRGMGLYRDARGHQALYVAGVSANEYIPELAAKYPPRLLHTSDGRHFRATTPKRNFTVTTLSGTRKPMGFRSMEVIDGRFFATASTGLTGDGAIVRITRPWDSRRASFKQVSPTNVAVFEIEKFHHHLYAGTGDNVKGYSVYRALDRNPRSDRWTALVNNGAGRGVTLTSVVSMHVFKGQLYVGSSGWLNVQQTLPATEVIRIRPDNSWDLVVGNVREDHNVLKFPVSGLGDGWGSGFVAHPWRMESKDGALYVGTNDFSTSLLNQVGSIGTATLAGQFGFDIWASCDGTYWFPVTRDAYGGHDLDFGARTMQATPYGVAVGSANHAQGTTVFLDRRPACKSGIKTTGKARAASVAEGPGSLLADAQRDGTVLSWTPGAAGTTYEVQRADMPEVPVKTGGHTVDVVGYGAFKAIGTTRSTVFVDRGRTAGRHYAYKVVARAADGSTAGSTGIQTVPVTESAPTGERLQRQLRYADLAGGPVQKG